MVSEIGWFFYREMVTRRKQLEKPSIARSISYLIDLYCGYGEKPLRLVAVSLMTILSFTLLYASVGLQHGSGISSFSSNLSLVGNLRVLFDSLYFSVVTFTTLGYGDFSPIGFSRLIASIEAIVGSFTIAVFVVVFVRRMTR